MWSKAVLMKLASKAGPRQASERLDLKNLYVFVWIVFINYYYFEKNSLNFNMRNNAQLQGSFPDVNSMKTSTTESNSNGIPCIQDSQECLFWVFITCSLVHSLWNTWNYPLLDFWPFLICPLKIKKIVSTSCLPSTAVKEGSLTFFPKESRDATSWAMCRNVWLSCFFLFFLRKRTVNYKYD